MNRLRFLLYILLGVPFLAKISLAETVTGEGIKVEIDIAGGQTSAAISGVPVEAANVFAIEGPARLVIDLPGARIKKSQNFKAHTGLVKGVRLGTYPDKARVVLDLTSASAPSVKSEVIGDQLLIELGETPAAASTQIPTELPIGAPVVTAAPTATAVPTEKPLETPTAATTETLAIQPGVITLPEAQPTLTPTAAPTESIEAVLLPTFSPTQTPKNTPTEKPTLVPPAATTEPTQAPRQTSSSLSAPTGELAKPLPGGPIAVQRFEFDYLPEDRAPVLKIGLSQRTEYKLSRVDQKTFKLVVPGSHLAGRFLTLPQFPPGDFVGLASVQARPLRDDVEISISVDLGARLASFSKENEIWVRTLNK